MPAGPPKMIITDQDPAMTKTIATLLPNTVHRYCIWHILSKFSEKISAVSYKQHYDEFRDCIWNSESPEEFEGRWIQVVAKAKLSTNEWLHAMYEICERWVPAFTRHIFSAHMTSSQRAEGSHAFFKRYVSPNNTLFEFVTQFERALSHIRHNELDADHKDVNEKPLLVMKTLMESTMRDLYTHSIFYKFQQEVLDSGMYVVKSTFKDEHWSKYNVMRANQSDSRGREVSLDKASNFVRCSCKKFECDGIPYRHMLRYFSKKQIVQLPDQYILWRLTKSANMPKDDLGGIVSKICDTPMLLKRNRLFQLAGRVIDVCLQVGENEPEDLEEYLVSTEKRVATKMNAREDGEGSSIKKPVSVGNKRRLKEGELLPAFLSVFLGTDFLHTALQDYGKSIFVLISNVASK